jgi:anti-sigma B factor antagonist
MKFSRTDDTHGVTLRIEGDLDAFTAPELRPVLDQLAAEKVTRVVVDLSELRLIDSSGVGVIVSLYKRVRANEGDMSISGLNGQPLAIFKLLNLDRVFSLG